MRKNLLFAVLAFICVLELKAQQAAQYSQYMINPYLINPALAGSEDFVDIKAGYRSQWQGFEGAPRTMYLSAHSSIAHPHEYYHHKGERHNWHGAGLLVMSDKIGPIQNNSYMGSYSYNIRLTKDGRMKYGVAQSHGIHLTFGLAFGVRDYSMDLTQTAYYTDGNGNQQNYDFVDSEDPLYNNGTLRKLTPDANLGMWLYNDDFYFGLSSTQLLGNKLEFDGVSIEDEASGDVLNNLSRLKRHVFITGGYRMKISYNSYFVPSFLIKKVAVAPWSVDINGRYQVELDKDNNVFAGISYRHRDAIAFLVGGNFMKHIDIAYSYDFTTTDIRNTSSGVNVSTHEVTVGYRLLPHGHLNIAERWW